MTTGWVELAANLLGYTTEEGGPREVDICVSTQGDCADRFYASLTQAAVIFGEGISVEKMTLPD